MCEKGGCRRGGCEGECEKGGCEGGVIYERAGVRECVREGRV